MRSFKKKLNEWTSQMIDLPPDVLHDIPRMTMIGNRQIYIENHRGIVRFSNEALKLAVSNGFLELHGSQLIICAITSEEILIEGLINELKYITDGKR
jgi:sporulation protein YqfC